MKKLWKFAVLMLLFSGITVNGCKTNDLELTTSTQTPSLMSDMVSTEDNQTSLVTDSNGENTSQPEQMTNSWLNLAFPSGEYIFIEGISTNSNVFYAMYTLENDEIVYLPEDGPQLHPIGENGAILLYDVDYDSEEFKYKSIKLSSFTNPEVKNDLPLDCWYRDISSDGKYLLVSECLGVYKNEIGVLEVNTQNIIQLTKSSESENDTDRHLGTPVFSPDGNWILYFDVTAKNELDEKNGLYLMPSSCISSPETCKDQTLGPFITENIYLSDEDRTTVWSPDSSKILVRRKNPHGFMIFDLVTMEFVELGLELDNLSRNLNWLAEDDLILFTSTASSGQERNNVLIFDQTSTKLDSIVFDATVIYRVHRIVIK